MSSKHLYTYLTGEVDPNQLICTRTVWWRCGTGVWMLSTTSVLCRSLPFLCLIYIRVSRCVSEHKQRSVHRCVVSVDDNYYLCSTFPFLFWFLHSFFSIYILLSRRIYHTFLHDAIENTQTNEQTKHKQHSDLYMVSNIMPLVKLEKFYDLCSIATIGHGWSQGGLKKQIKILAGQQGAPICVCMIQQIIKNVRRHWYSDNPLAVTGWSSKTVMKKKRKVSVWPIVIPVMLPTPTVGCVVVVVSMMRNND